MNERDILLRLQKPLKLSTAATLQRHPAGEVNHVFQLQDVHLNAAVKWLGEDSFSGVNRRSQFDLQQQLAALGVAKSRRNPVGRSLGRGYAEYSQR